LDFAKARSLWQDRERDRLGSNQYPGCPSIMGRGKFGRLKGLGKGRVGRLNPVGLVSVPAGT
jgi:hypothetical protein